MPQWSSFITCICNISALLFLINLISIFFTFLIMLWIMKNYFSNYYFYIVFLSTFLTVVIYRIVYILLYFSYSFLFLNNQKTIAMQFLFDFVWEAFLTAIFSTLFYLLFFRLLKVINPSYIFFRNKSLYGKK